jgi:hypothetical protein
MDFTSKGNSEKKGIYSFLQESILMKLNLFDGNKASIGAALSISY